MRQKIHPHGFRLGTTQSHVSIWFAQPRNYSENLKEDKIIRDCINNYIQKTIRISSSVEGMGLPNLLIDGKPRGIEELQTNVQKKT